MDYIIQKKYIASVELEISVDANGYNFLVLYGKHINGGWCAIPNHGVACEMGDANDTFYNAEALIHCGMSVRCARAIAAAIAETAAKMGVQ